MSTSTHQPAVPSFRDDRVHGWPRRVSAAVATTAAAVATWSIITAGFDATIHAPTFDTSPPARSASEPSLRPRS